MPNSSRLVLPISSAPAALRRVTAVASYGATKPSNIFDPAVAGQSLTKMLSLTAIFKPLSGPSPPSIGDRFGSAFGGPERRVVWCESQFSPPERTQPALRLFRGESNIPICLRVSFEVTLLGGRGGTAGRPRLLPPSLMIGRRTESVDRFERVRLRVAQGIVLRPVCRHLYVQLLAESSEQRQLTALRICAPASTTSQHHTTDRSYERYPTRSERSPIGGEVQGT